MRYIQLVLLLMAAIQISAKNYYVAPCGDDNAEGTLDKPFATFGKAQSLAEAGDTVFFRQGIYHVREQEIQSLTEDKRYADVFLLSRSGEENKPIVFTGYGLERATFDFSDIHPEGKRISAFVIKADWIVMRQIDVTGVQVTVVGHSQSECVRFRGGSHCLLDNMAFHDGMAIGVYMLEGKDNLILNCDAYNNFDSVSDGGYGGNVDGFGAHLTSAEYTGNVFSHCRAWWNSDDGFDLINCLAPVRIEYCVAFYNGFRPGTLYRAGDGTGFKAGGYGMKPKAGMVRKVDVVPQHVVDHCIAYRNKNKGIYSNHHLGGVMFTDNVSIGNPKNYTMLCRKSAEEAVDIPGEGHILRNNISLRPLSKGMDYTDMNESKCIFENNVTESTMQKKEGLPYFDVDTFRPEDYLQPRNADGTLKMPFSNLYCITHE